MQDNTLPQAVQQGDPLASSPLAWSLPAAAVVLEHEGMLSDHLCAVVAATMFGHG